HMLNIASTPELVIGLTCYALGAIAYILVLTRVKLSIAAPAVALSYIFPVLIGYFVFRESIPPIRLVGLGLIISGVVLLIRQP
ncbi:MAG TPA: EamA family transporter, partial [Chroococcidiopsis sp.]